MGSVSRDLQEISSLCSGQLKGSNVSGLRTIAFDSRRISANPSILFIALRGSRKDGHEYIAELYQRGLRAFIVSSLPDLSLYPEAGFCLVENCLKALQKMATAIRADFGGKVIGITGSNGKTIVKEWAARFLDDSREVYRSPQSYNSQLGVALSLCSVDGEAGLALIEAGISQPGEMDVLEAMIRPEIGIFTHLGTAHQENFTSPEAKLEEKLRLFRSAEKLVYREGVPGADALRRSMEGSSCKLIGWSTGESGLYRYRLSTSTAGGSSVNVKGPACDFIVQLPFEDEASLENALHALTLALELGARPEALMRASPELQPVSMRLELLRGLQDSILINDSYNADIGGLEAALALLGKQGKGSRKVLILSDLHQSGLAEDQLYSEVARLIRQKSVDLFIGIGPAMRRQQKLFSVNSLFFSAAREFIDSFNPRQIRNSAVLIKGSRAFQFEKITARLQMQTHETRLEIDLDAMRFNLNLYRSKLKEGVRTMVMVKALSYGSGNVEIARFLQEQGVDYLAVAYIDEGLELRRSGIALPIMVMNPHKDGFPQMIDYRLEPEIYSFSMLHELLRELDHRKETGYPVHLKIDSGMHRLGFGPGQVDELIPLLQRPELEIASVFSHLAASDSRAHDDFTREQIRVFRQAAGRISRHMGKDICTHILNSAGIMSFPEAQFQMVRLGIGLHGVSGLPGSRPVSSFMSSVSQLRMVEAGESIGYGRMERVRERMEVATLPVGYADGMDRRLGLRKGQVWIRGRRADIVGQVCMDMLMVDVTGMDVQEGDEVELFGEHIPVDELASRAGTIAYEILTSVPGRVKRVYLQE